MKTSLTKVILAVVTVDKNAVAEGGVPIFFAANKEEQEKMATTLARITEGVVHELENGVRILVKH